MADDLSSGSSSQQGCALHHVGLVVASIAREAASFAESLGGVWDAIVFDDPLQMVRVTFLECGSTGAPRIELVEPVGEDSPVFKFLKRGGGLHHLCYEVDNLEQQLEFSRSVGALVVRSPLPAVAFRGRLIAWVYTKNRLLLEYLERC